MIDQVKVGILVRECEHEIHVGTCLGNQTLVMTKTTLGSIAEVAGVAGCWKEASLSGIISLLR